MCNGAIDLVCDRFIVYSHYCKVQVGSQVSNSCGQDLGSDPNGAL